MKASMFLAIAISFFTMTSYSQSLNHEFDPENVLKCARKYNYVHSFESDSCFILDASSDTEVLLREYHLPECGGDPDTMPLRAVFIVLNGELHIRDSATLEDFKCTEK